MANSSPFTPREVQDHVFSFEAGVNMGVAPLILPKNQLGQGTNITVRGTLVTQRPPFRLIPIAGEYPSDGLLAFEHGKYQGGCYFKPDNGFESLMCQIDGRLFQVTPGTNSASIIERTIPGDPNPIAPNQAWLWQSEKWVICNDGQSIPIFFDQTATPTTRRSLWNTKLNFSTYSTTANIVVPAINTAASAITFNDVTNLNLNDTVTIKNLGTAIVQAIAGNNVTLVNLTCPVGKTFPTGTALKPNITWSQLATELPPGRMGAYGMGQNWFSLLDGQQFVASDQVGASSGTQAQNYRDSVLNIQQNLYLAGGGNFVLPGGAGEIRAFIFTPALDASLGQGPLQVFTPNISFTCNVPADRLTWQDVTNPILAESSRTNGSLSQWATFVANSDTIMRSIDGLRSLILARRDFNTWGNVPISREVDPILSKDSPDLLQFCSGIVFDNRQLITASPVLSDQGVYWQQIIALNMDPISSLRGKAPSVYDGSWTGLNVLQLITGLFSGVQRAFAFCLNTIFNRIELYEILRQDQAYYDNDVERIVSAYQLPVMLREVNGKTAGDLCRIVDGEIYLDQIRNTVGVQVWYKPDSYPCWIPWRKFSICNPKAEDDPFQKPGYRTRLGLGQPSADDCEVMNGRPTRMGYWFQFRIVVTGPHRFLGLRVKAALEPQPQFAPVAGCCQNESPL